MNVLSLFDGISCGSIALKRAGHEVNTFYASEIEASAIAIANHNFPNNIQLGDITRWQEWDIDWKSIDFLMGGSPCQSFSKAGKQEGLEGKSGLIEYFFQILFHIQSLNPSVRFLLENVKMRKEWQNYISDKLGVQPIEINSKLVSAQTRNRLYWTNIPNVTAPTDKGLTLADIKQDVVDSKYYLSQKLLDGFKRKRERRSHMNSGFDKLNIRSLSDKVSCITARIHKCSMSDPYIEDEKGIRRLTPLECERAQTLPDNYTLVPYKGKMLSDTARYHGIGNGWTVDVIAHILSFLHV